VVACQLQITAFKPDDNNNIIRSISLRFLFTNTFQTNSMQNTTFATLTNKQEQQ
jgi:hypothetical protein